MQVAVMIVANFLLLKYSEKNSRPGFIMYKGATKTLQLK